jgi:hypothetical protein
MSYEILCEEMLEVILFGEQVVLASRASLWCYLNNFFEREEAEENGGELKVYSIFGEKLK